MNRRSFLKRLLGAAGAVAAGPVVLELAKKLPLAERAADTIWINTPYEASFVIPSQEILDHFLAKTTWYWNENALKRLTRGVGDHVTIKPYYPK